LAPGWFYEVPRTFLANDVCSILGSNCRSGSTSPYCKKILFTQFGSIPHSLSTAFTDIKTRYIKKFLGGMLDFSALFLPII
jgi:hypothetical protein